jgi:hypothetical protein
MNGTIRTARPVDSSQVDAHYRQIANEIVNRTAALLDAAVPSWAEAIDLSDFDISSCQDCMVGQLAEVCGFGPIVHLGYFGNAATALIHLIDPGNTANLSPEPGEYGFDFWENALNFDDAYDALQIAWTNAILDRIL